MGRGGNDLSLKVILSAQDMASGKLKGFGSTLVNLAGDAGPLLKVFGGISLAAIGFAASSVQMAAQYQQSMNMVQALTGASQSQMNQYDAGLKNLAMDAGVAPTKLSQGLYYVISAGYQGADAMKMLTLSTQDAVIGLTDSKITANALTTVMQGFNEKTSDMVKVNGEMLRTVTLGKMSMQDYAGAVSKVAVLHAQYKVTLEDTNATLATLTSSGYKSASIAATGYSQLVGIMDGKTDLMTKRIDKMLGSTTRYVTVLKDVHGQMVPVIEKQTVQNKGFDEAYFKTLSYSGQLAYLNNVMKGHYDQLQNVLGGSKQAAGAFTTLETHSQMFANNLKSLSNQQKNATATQSAWSITQSGFTQTMNRAGAAVQVLMIDIGQQLLPVLTKIVGVVAPVVTWLLNFATAVSKNEVAMAFLKGALVGFVVVLLAILVPAFWAWATAAFAAAAATLAATWPILLIGAIVAAVVAGIILAVQHWGQIVTWLKGVWGHVVDFFKGVWEGIVKVFQAVGKFFAQVFSIIVAIFSPIVTVFKDIFMVLLYIVIFIVNLIIFPWRMLFTVIVAIFTALLPFFRAIWNGIVAVFSAVAGWFQSIFQAAWNAIVSVWNVVKGWFQNIWNGIVQIFSPVVTWFSTQFTNATNAVKNVFGVISGWFKNLWNGIVNDFKNIFGGLGNIFQNIWNTVTNVFKGGVNWFIDRINWLIDRYNGLPKFGAPNISHIAHLATGGVIPPGGLAFVAESGTGGELVQGLPGGGARVFSGTQSRGMLARSSGGRNVTLVHNGDVIIQVPSGDPRQIYQYFKQQQDREFRRSGSIVTTSSGGRAS